MDEQTTATYTHQRTDNYYRQRLKGRQLLTDRQLRRWYGAGCQHSVPHTWVHSRCGVACRAVACDQEQDGGDEAWEEGLAMRGPGWTYTINDCFADTACLLCELMSRLRHSSRACRSVSGYGIILPLASAASFCGGGNVRPGAMQDQSLVTQVDGAWMLFTYNFPAVLDSLLHLHICFPAVLIHTVTTCW